MSWLQHIPDWRPSARKWMEPLRQEVGSDPSALVQGPSEKSRVLTALSS